MVPADQLTECIGMSQTVTVNPGYRICSAVCFAEGEQKTINSVFKPGCRHSEPPNVSVDDKQ